MPVSRIAAATDESNTLELQQWNSMWDHLFSMITQIIEVPECELAVESPVQRRAALVDLVGKLCEVASQPVDPDAFHRLQAKYQKCKSSFRALKSENQAILEEVEKQRVLAETHLAATPAEGEPRLVSTVLELETLLKAQLSMDAEFLPLDARQSSIRTRIRIDNDSDLMDRSPRGRVSRDSAPTSSDRRAGDAAGRGAGKPSNMDKLIALTGRLHQDYLTLGTLSLDKGVSPKRPGFS
jgi:hypothetical protein